MTASLLGPDRHLDRWIVLHRAGWLDHVFVDLTRVGTAGAVWLAIASQMRKPHPQRE